MDKKELQRKKKQKTEFQKKLGEHLILLRKKQGITQAELARRMEKDRQSLERIENGKTNPTSFYLAEIARALNISLKEIFDFK
jgi:putative transcriptional regulator